MPSVKRAARELPSTNSLAKRTAPPPDLRMLVCAVRGISGQAFTVTINADASVHELKKRILEENALQLSHASAPMLNVYSTQQYPGGWAPLNRHGCMEDIDNPQFAPLLPTQRVRYYFPPTIPAFDSGVVHVVAEVENTPMAIVPSGVGILPGEKPYEGVEDFDSQYERYEGIREALGLIVDWAIDSTDFSQRHSFQGAKWLEYETLSREPKSRVSIMHAVTWRDLYVATP